MSKKSNLVHVTPKMVAVWTPAFENFLGEEAFRSLSSNKQKILAGIAAAKYSEFTGGIVGLEADMSFISADNTSLAKDVNNPTAGQHNGLVNKSGNPGSGDRQFLVGICIAIAAKTIGLELVQTVPATSQNVTIKYVNVIYNGGKLDNAAHEYVHVVTIKFPSKPTLTVGRTYVVGHATPDSGDDAKAYEFLEVKYIKADREGVNSHIFELQNAFTATKTDLALTDVEYVAQKPAIATVVADGKFWSINAGLDTLSAELEMVSVANTKAIENYVPNQTTRGLRRTLTRSEADSGTDRELEIEIKNEAHVIGNRVFTGNISRLQYKTIVEQGIDAVPYLTAAMKNEVSQEINWQIVSACRAYGISNAIAYAANGMNFNTYIGPSSVNNVAFDSIPYANELFDKDMVSVAGKFSAVSNLTKTMQYETIASIGTYICMLITQAAFAIGTDSRYGEADAVVVGSGIGGFLAASSSFTKLNDKDVDMTGVTGAKLSGYINGIKVYVDVQSPQNNPFITVLRTNQDVKIDVPGIEDDTILVPGLVYLVKDLISSTELVPEKTAGKKLIMDSETDLIAIGDRPEAGYLTFAFYVNLPGLAG